MSGQFHQRFFARNFRTKYWCQKFQTQNTAFVQKFGAKNALLYKKCVCKTLMKLTHGHPHRHTQKNTHTQIHTLTLFLSVYFHVNKQFMNLFFLSFFLSSFLFFCPHTFLTLYVNGVSFCMFLLQSHSLNLFLSRVWEEYVCILEQTRINVL